MSPWLSSSRKGFTLTELLVAIMIVVIVGLALVPLVLALVSDFQNRGVPGGTRLTMSSFTVARDRAVRDRALYGIRLVRDETNPWLVDRVQFLQTPDELSMPASADSDGIDNNGDGLIDEPGEGTVLIDRLLSDGLDNDGDGLIDEPEEAWGAFGVITQWLGLIRVGDHLQISNEKLYEITGPDLSPADGIIDSVNNPAVWVCLDETYPNHEGTAGSIDCKGEIFTSLGYSLVRQPGPGEDQEEVLLPDGVVINVLRSRGLPNGIPLNALALVGFDGQPGVAGIDDDANGTPDDITELGTPGSDDVPVSAWPQIDILFAPSGQVTGEGARSALIHLWITERGNQSVSGAPNPSLVVATPADLAASRIVTLNTRTGFVQTNEVDGTDANGDGILDNPYRFADFAIGTTRE